MKLNYNNILIIIVIFIIFVLYMIYDTYSPIETFTSENKLTKFKKYVEHLIMLNDNEKNIRKAYRNSIISFRNDNQCNTKSKEECVDPCEWDNDNTKCIETKKEQREKFEENFFNENGGYSFCLLLKELYEEQNNILSKLKDLCDEFVSYTFSKEYFKKKKEIFDSKKSLNEDIIGNINDIEKDKITSLSNLNNINNINFNYEDDNSSLIFNTSDIREKFEQYDVYIRQKFTNIEELDGQYNFFKKINEILSENDQKNKLNNTYLNILKKVQTYENNIDKILKQILDMLNRTDANIFNDKDSNSKFIKSADDKNKILLKYCKKLKLLDKPKNANLITKRFNKEYINKKNEHIKKLEGEMAKLQSELFKTEINKYNAYKLRTDDQSRKQYNAIVKGIDNITNSNNLKFNIV